MGSTFQAAWAWSMEEKGDFSDLYEAIWEEDCEAKYSESCRAYFAKANLTLGHAELWTNAQLPGKWSSF